MIIRSDFYDYYDSIQKSGVDHSLQYFRKKEISTIEFPLPYLRSNRCFETILIGFCNRFYTLCFYKNYIEGTKTFISSIEDIDKIVESNLNKRQQQAYYNNKYKNFMFCNGVFYCSFVRKSFIEYFKELEEIKIRPSIELINLFSIYNCPIFSIENSNHHQNLTINPKLSDYEFYRILDPYTCYQEISMYLGGLAKPEKEIPYIDDKIMAQAKGFDKYSFRKDKQS